MVGILSFFFIVDDVHDLFNALFDELFLFLIATRGGSLLLNWRGCRSGLADRYIDLQFPDLYRHLKSL